jgi:prepilin-type N-terminal cleavage/methylation domain-containing protein
MRYNRDITGEVSEARAKKRRGCAGVTLIELIVAIVILGVISAWAITNWSGFVRHQELRQEAHGLHTDIMAMRARALGERDTIWITFPTTNSYTIERKGPDDANRETIRTANLNNNVTVNSPNYSGLGTPLGELTVPDTSNAWATTTGIVIRPDNLNAFNIGWITINNGSNRQFAIAKVSNGVNPELFQRIGAGGWTRTRR